MKKDIGPFQGDGHRGKVDSSLRPDRPHAQHLPPDWSRFIWFFLVMVGLQWFWLEAAHQLTVQTIPYCEFKTMLAQGRLMNATIGDSEITGKIRGAPPVAEQKKATAEKSSPVPTAATKTVGAANEKKVPQNAKPSGSEPAAKEKAPPKPTSFLFRTVQVEDPNLADEMQKAGVEFSGEHPRTAAESDAGRDDGIGRFALVELSPITTTVIATSPARRSYGWLVPTRVCPARSLSLQR